MAFDPTKFGGQLQEDASGGGAHPSDTALALDDDTGAVLGTGSDASITYNTTQTPDALVVGLGADSNSLIICEEADKTFDFAHAQDTNPAVYIHSAAQNTTDWIGFWHDQTSAHISTGDGPILFGAQTTSHSLTGTGDIVVGILEVNSNCYLDGAVTCASTIDAQGGVTLSSWAKFTDNVTIIFGTGSDAQMKYNNGLVPNGLVLGVGADNNALIICEKADFSFNFAHALATNPTVFIHSANQNTTQWLGLTHNATDAVVSSGTGGIQLNPAAAANGETFGLYSTTTTVDLSVSGTATNFMPAGSTVVGFSSYVTATITGSGVTGYTLGEASGDVDRWGAVTGTAIGTSSKNANWTNNFPLSTGAAKDVVVTATGGTFTGGTVRLTIHYFSNTAPTA